MGALSEELRERIRQEFSKYPNKRAVTLPALSAMTMALTKADGVRAMLLLSLGPIVAVDAFRASAPGGRGDDEGAGTAESFNQYGAICNLNGAPHDPVSTMLWLDKDARGG